MLTTLALTIALAGPAHATTPTLQRPIARHLEQTAFDRAPLAAQARFAQAGSRDSLQNGAAIGAVVGGVATGLLSGFLCHALNDTEANCWPAVLALAAGGAGAGRQDKA
ncbi:MAG: hypothetical protein WD227_07830 [Vicinamibacterales bacterium]